MPAIIFDCARSATEPGTSSASPLLRFGGVVKRRLSRRPIIAGRIPRKSHIASILRRDFQTADSSRRSSVSFVQRLQRFEDIQPSPAERLTLKRRNDVAVE